jgi:hypothetical protein
MMLTTTAAAAPLSTGANEPYTWRILLKCSKHPFLDDAFRARLARELKAALAPGLGPLGGVEVIDTDATASADAIVRDFKNNGLAALDPSVRTLSTAKYHGLILEYRNSAFHLATRQFDSFTGLTSPITRTRTVRTQDQIARIAGLMLEPDFGVAGTVETILDDDKHVTLRLQASEFGNVDKQCAKGDIFAVSVVKDVKPVGQVATPIAYTLLKAVEDPAKGMCKCVILSRWASPFGREARQAAGRRAMKLPTITGNVTLQLVDPKGKPHARGSRLTVTASDVDFTARPGERDGFEWRDGVWRSIRPFTNVACISVGVGQDRPQLFPAAIMNGDALTLKFDIDAAAEQRAEFVRECEALLFKALDLSSAQVANAKAMSQLIDAVKFKEALARAEAALVSLAAGEKMIAEELKQLKAQPAALDNAAKLVLEKADDRLIAVRDGIQQIGVTITTLKDAIGKSTSPETLAKEFRGKELASRITELIQRGDIPDAIAAYDQLIAHDPGNPAHKDAREKLQAEWAPKDDAHRAARDCIRVLGAAKTLEEIKGAMESVRLALPVLKTKKDRLGLRKLANTFEPALHAFLELQNAHEKTPESPGKVQTADELKEIYNTITQYESTIRNVLRELANEKK